MKFATASVFLAVCPSITATDAWGSDACEYDSEVSVSLLQKHVRTGTAARMKPRVLGADDVAVAKALTSEIDDVLEQAVDDEFLGQNIARSMKSAESQINNMRSGRDVGVVHKEGNSDNIRTLVVDVPAVKVIEVPMMHHIPIVVDDEEEEEDEEEESSPQNEVSDSCVSSLEKLLTNAQKVDKARKCEEKKGHSDKAIEALQKMDTDAALKNIEKTFHQCGGISKKCSKELAPEEMLKMRLSGIAMEQKCADVAAEQDMEPDAESVTCQTKAGQSIVDALRSGDVADALDQAQNGLSKCDKIKHPCDFQLAPLLVGQLIQSQEEGAQAEPLQPGEMFLSQDDGFSALVDNMIRPSYYQALLLQE